MAPKILLDKEAWQWAETTDPEHVTNTHVEIAYRIVLLPCAPNSCRRNCKGNPHCLVALGEKEWLGEIADENWHEIDDPNTERRPTDSYVGLKNLGATCYVNSLLQLWFHNPIFRKSIYQWNPEFDPQEEQSQGKSARHFQSASQMQDDILITFAIKSSPTITSACNKSCTEKIIHEMIDKTSKQLGEFSTSEEYSPVSVIGQLQLTFALLQYSCRRYIDPSPLIKCLGLNTSQQQDAQEFSKLFMNLLEDKLQYQKNPRVRSIVQEQFRGKYAYVTTCTNCQQDSTCLSTFYELDLNIKGNKELDECIKEFLHEEKLEGPNQYFCSYCQSKQNAIRKIKLIWLPPVLNLQLLRFVFDRQSSHKKKLNSFIRFPEVLDMSNYISQKDENKQLYDLSAVLIHRGPSAYSGHYIAHIKDRETSSWFKFNDEEIEKIEGKNLKLGVEEDIDEGGQGKKVKLAKGYYASKNAYMLVYTKRSSEIKSVPYDNSEEWDIPEKLQEIVLKDNSKFEEWVCEMSQMREQNVLCGKAKQSEIKELYQLLPATEGQDFEWISTEWLCQWLSNEPVVKSVDNSDCICPHERLDPDCVSKMKCISQEAANIIYTKYGGGPRLTRKAMCQDCVVKRCQHIRIKVRVQEDHKFVMNMLKNPVGDGDAAYWIGKYSLKSWKKFVLDRYSEENKDDVGNENGDQNVDESSNFKTEDNPEDQMEGCGVDSESQNSYLGFNEEIMCIHNNLSINETARRLIQAEVWHRLKTHFPNAPEFSRCTESCSLCQEMKAEDLLTRDRYRFMAVEQKSVLSDLYHDKNRPFGNKARGLPLYIINTEFVEQWRKFVKDPARREPVLEVCNSSLLCHHGGLSHQPQKCIEIMDTKNKLILVWESEWFNICRFFSVDCEIKVQWINVGDGNSQALLETADFYCIPGVCESCYIARLQEEQLQLLDYTGAKIFVRKVSPCPGNQSAGSGNSGIVGGGGGGGGDLAAAQLDASDQEDGGDPEFTQVGIPKKKKKLNNGSEKVHMETSTQVRRSLRQRRTRGEKEIIVSSNQTLMDLKVQIMKLFHVANYDQHLSLNGRELTDNKASLASLNVYPGSVIILQADEPCGDTILEEEYMKAAVPEEGFKGTELLRR